MQTGAREGIRRRPYVWQDVPWTDRRVLTRGWVDGLPALAWGRADRDQLATARQLRELGLRPDGQAPVAVLVFGHRAPGRRPVEYTSLYRIADAVPKRTATAAQRAAIAKALAARRTCHRCGEEQNYYLSTTSRLCGPCEDATGFWDDRPAAMRPGTAGDEVDLRSGHVGDLDHEPLGERAELGYVCEECGTTEQWSCDCWELEAAKYGPDRIADEDRPWWAALVEDTAPNLDGVEPAAHLREANLADDPGEAGLVDLPVQRSTEPPQAAAPAVGDDSAGSSPVDPTAQAIQRAQRALAQIEQHRAAGETTAAGETRTGQLARWHTDDQAAREHATERALPAMAEASQ